MNYLLPQQKILSMHCSPMSARVVMPPFFSAFPVLARPPSRPILPGLSSVMTNMAGATTGFFNIEGGCYAKVIRLSPIAEPDIYQTTRRFGTILENVGFDSDSGRIDLNDDSLTENTRASYPSVTSATPPGKDCVVILKCHHAHLRCLRGPAASCQTDTGTGSVSFSFRLIPPKWPVLKKAHRAQPPPSACFGAPVHGFNRATVYANCLGKKLLSVSCRLADLIPLERGPHGVRPTLWRSPYTRAIVMLLWGSPG